VDIVEKLVRPAAKQLNRNIQTLNVSIRGTADVKRFVSK
jgi:hypothetical protein